MDQSRGSVIGLPELKLIASLCINNSEHEIQSKCIKVLDGLNHINIINIQAGFMYNVQFFANGATEDEDSYRSAINFAPTPANYKCTQL